MHSLTFRIPAGVVAAALLTLTLSACTPETPPPTDTAAAPSATTTAPAESPSRPAATPTAAPVGSAPSTRINLGCADFDNPRAQAETYVQPIAAVDPATTSLASDPALPTSYLVEANGGVACEWSNGRPTTGVNGESTGYVGVTVTVLPDVNQQWEQFVATYLVSDGYQIYCTNASPVFCTFNSVVRGYWVEIAATGLDVPDPTDDPYVQVTFKAVYAPVMAALRTATVPRPADDLPAGTLPLPEECDGIIAPEQVQEVLSFPEALRSSTDGRDWDQAAAAYTEVSELPCRWVFGNGDLGVGTLRWLPGGSWAATQAVATPAVPQAAQPVAVPGLAAGDAAFVRCAENNDGCWIDLLLGGNWIQASLSPSRPGVPELGVDRRTAVVAIGERIVANLTG